MKEIWKDVVGWEGLYQVSNLGRVKSLPWVGHHKNDIIMKMFGNGTGYLTVMLYKPAKKKLVHRLVAEAFIPRPDGKAQINHIDGNKTNNRVDNLEWCTQSENMRHRVDVLGIRPASHHVVKVRCIETGRVFRSAAEAARSVGLSRSGIGAALRKSYTTCFREGKMKSYQSKTAGGYHWEYV